MKKLFLCTCNNTLNQSLDFAKIEKECSKFFDAIETVDSLCLQDDLAKLKKKISADDRVAIGACSAQIIGIPVEQTIKNDFISYVPLREHVAWVHPEESKSATNKAIVLLADVAVKLDHLEAPTDFESTSLEHRSLNP